MKHWLRTLLSPKHHSSKKQQDLHEEHRKVLHSPFSLLPFDVFFTHIFPFLSFKQLCKCMTVCKFWNRQLNTSFCIQTMQFIFNGKKFKHASGGYCSEFFTSQVFSLEWTLALESKNITQYLVHFPSQSLSNNQEKMIQYFIRHIPFAIQAEYKHLPSPVKESVHSIQSLVKKLRNASHSTTVVDLSKEELHLLLSTSLAVIKKWFHFQELESLIQKHSATQQHSLWYQKVYKAYQSQFVKQFKYMNETLQKDREVVMEICKIKGNHFKRVANFFSEDKELILLAIKTYPKAIRYAHSSLQKDRYFILQAIQWNSKCFKYVAHLWNSDKRIVMTTLHKNAKQFQFISDSLRDCREVVLLAVKRHGNNLKFASKSCRNDKEIVFAAIKSWKFAFADASEELKHDKEFITEAVLHNANVFRDVSETLKLDKEFVIHLLHLHNEKKTPPSFLQYVNTLLKNDKEFMKQAQLILVALLLFVQLVQCKTFMPLKTSIFDGSGVVNGVATDSLGNVVSIGTFSSSMMTIDRTQNLTLEGGTDSFVMKRNSTGDVVFALTVGGTRNENINHVAIDLNNDIIVTGTFNSVNLTVAGQLLQLPRHSNTNLIRNYCFLLKFSSNGTLRFASSFGAGNYDTTCNNVVTDNANNIIFVGTISESTYFGTILVSNSNAKRAGFVAKVDSTGTTCFWANRFYTAVNGVQTIAQFNQQIISPTILLSTDKSSSSNSVFVNLGYDSTSVPDMLFGNDSGILIYSSTTQNSILLVTKISSSGVHEFTTPLGSSPSAYSRGIFVNQFGVTITGAFDNNMLINTTGNTISCGSNPCGFVYKRDHNNGNVVIHTFQATQFAGQGVVVNSRNETIVSATLYGTIVLNNETFSSISLFDPILLLLSLDYQGNVTGARSFRTNSVSQSLGISIDSNDSLYFFGSYRGTMYLGNTKLSTGSQNTPYMASAILVDSIFCSGIDWKSSNVCSNSGFCEATNYCYCTANNTYGFNCNVTSCQGILGDDSNVCSGRGICSTYNT